MNFEFLSAGKIVFGPGRAEALGEIAAPFGARALLVTGRSAERSRFAEERLSAAGIAFDVFRVHGEPSTETLERALDVGRSCQPEFVVAFGGGSAIDLGKAVAALLPARGSVFDHLEVVGKGRPLDVPALPVVAVPTTSGTGAEVTKNAVLTSLEHRVKVSLRHESMLPRVALVDPRLTLAVPADVTAATGLDALTQCLEPFVSNAAQPITDALVREGLERGARSLLRAVRHGDDEAARTDLSLCSLFGGLALANAKLGAVHGFAGPLGGFFDAPHGAICARLLPLVCEVNLRALRAREPAHPAIERYAEVARLLTGKSDARAEDGIAWISELAAELAIPSLAQYGMKSSDVAELVQRGKRASSMKGNPIALRDDELREILERAL